MELHSYWFALVCSDCRSLLCAPKALRIRTAVSQQKTSQETPYKISFLRLRLLPEQNGLLASGHLSWGDLIFRFSAHFSRFSFFLARPSEEILIFAAHSQVTLFFFP